jgi:[glutamine synthetase] adenylyltransferase / [glutamine synthetase]-adenylyl-L-tyrosine phosphorylase
VTAAVPPANQSLYAQLGTKLPQPSTKKSAAERLDTWVSGLAGMMSVDALQRLNQLLERPKVRRLLLGIADHSPFLWRLIAQDHDRLLALLERPPLASLRRLLSAVEADCLNSETDAELMQALRRAKQCAALLIALADLGGAWSFAEVTEALTQFADVVVAGAVGFLVRRAIAEGKLRAGSTAAQNCGVVVLALGKQGAWELNYSSDIDLIVLYDPSSAALAPASEPAAVFVALTKRMVRLLQESTSAGYVLRVDLRLRPDPGSTAIAISLPAAFAYYETVGQNWERAALIKARPIAGQLELGHRFLADLAPFIWRKFFDYAAIADIHAMKRQIHVFRGHAEVTVAGHDVKLGRGGIREIEFFVQTQQLIFGGRRPNLRGSRTLDTLLALQSDGWIDADALHDLTQAYIYLRNTEHRLQMLRDEQTQRLPDDQAELARFSAFCGYSTQSQFQDDLLHHMRRVERHYSRLFENAPELVSEAGDLVFTGVTNDPATLATLSRLGFSRPEEGAETVRGWHFGRRSAVRSARAREVLTELVPSLLTAFSESGDPDLALAAFDQALGRMPAAVELFSILKSNAKVRQLFSDILGSAPRLAQIVAQRPHLLDGAIDPDLLDPRSDDRSFDRRVQLILAPSLPTEDFLDRARDLAQEETFLIGVRLLARIFDPKRAGLAYSALAGSLVRATLAHVEHRFQADHSAVPNSGCCVLAMGKLGSREMNAGSDLDLILLYDFDPEHPDSTAPRPLHAVQYFARLTQRLISALTVPTRRGRLYDVDMRLRPSGRKGPVATQLASFVDYQRRSAETWEHMALTRARVIAGNTTTAQAAATAIRQIIRLERDPTRLRRDIVEMRDLIAQEKGDSNRWDLKLAAGGIVDIEFIAQYLVLRYAARHSELVDTATESVLIKADNLGLIGHSEAAALLHAHRLLRDATQMIRLTIEGTFEPSKVAEAVRRQIARGCSLPDFPTLDRELLLALRDVRGVFRALLIDKA